MHSNFNHLEKLRFTLILENLENRSINPNLAFGVDNTVDYQCQLNSGINEIIFDSTIYDSGNHFVFVSVAQQNNNHNSFKIRDLKIHGVSVTYHLYQSVYYPCYDKNYHDENPDILLEIPSGLYIGNDGIWKWFFDSPIYDNAKYKIGLW